MVAVAVLGGGPIGLFTALELIQGGHSVTVFDDADPKATYPKSAAFWLPFASGSSAEEARRYSIPTYDFYREFEDDVPDSGLFRRKLVHYSCRSAQGIYPHDRMDWLTEVAPESYSASKRRRWKPAQPLLKEADGVDVSELSIARSWEFETFAISPNQFMASFGRYLRNHPAAAIRFESRELNQGEICSEEFTTRFDALICCSGIKGFVDGVLPLTDQNLRPSKGVLARVPTTRKRNVIHLISDQPFTQHPVYFVPMRDELVFGGTVVAVDVNSADSLEVSELERQQLKSRFQKLLPREAELLDLNEASWTAGIRPKLATGPVVRFDDRCSEVAGLPVILNVGHGGSGFTFGYGCAIEVGQIVADQLGLQPTSE